MAEYDIAFAEKLAETAGMVAREGLASRDAQRTVLYLSLLSIEIALKAMLEKAGKPMSQIRGRSHRLPELLDDLGKCEVEVEVAPATRQYVPAARLRSCSVKHHSAEITLGKIIAEAGPQGASVYPNEVRYGDVLRHFPPEVVAQAAAATAAFAREHLCSIRTK